MEENKQETNTFAMTGFVLALVSLFLNFWGIMGILATVFSAIGLSKISVTKEKGKGLAIAGLVIGIFSILYAVLQLMLLIYE
jgi:hypothetical protein